MVPFADVFYFADKKWWDWHKERAEFKSLKGEKATVFVTGHLVDDPAVHMLRILQVPGISDDPAAICTGSNSGHQALNIAHLAGGEPKILVGYDAKDGAGGKKHFFGNHPDNTGAPYGNMLHEMKGAAEFFKQRGARVLNATPGSAIPYFPFVDLEETLSCL